MFILFSSIGLVHFFVCRLCVLFFLDLDCMHFVYVGHVTKIAFTFFGCRSCKEKKQDTVPIAFSGVLFPHMTYPKIQNARDLPQKKSNLRGIFLLPATSSGIACRLKSHCRITILLVTSCVDVA